MHFKILFIFLLLLPFSLVAETFELFVGGYPHYQYDELIREKQLKKGDVLVFSNGESFRFEGFLGRGNTTAILDIGNGRALRVPLEAGEFEIRGQEPIPYSDFIDYFIKGHQKYRQVDLPMVELHSYTYGEYAEVERVSSFSLQDFIDLYPKGSGHQKLSPAEIEMYRSALMEFARSLWGFTFIADFRPEQILWNRKLRRWVFGDLQTFEHTWSPGRWEHPFSSYQEENFIRHVFDAELDREIDRVIEEEREIMSHKCHLLKWRF